MPAEEQRRPRVALYCMFCLADQCDLAAEFKQMLQELGRNCDVLHLSMRGPRPAPEIGPTVKIEELALHVDRSSRVDIALKSLIQFFWTPIIAWHLRRFKADVFYMPDIIPLLPLLLHWCSGVPVASSYGDWHIHNKLEKKPWAKPLVAFAEWLERLEARKVDFFTCRASSATRRLASFGMLMANPAAAEPGRPAGPLRHLLRVGDLPLLPPPHRSRPKARS